MASVSLSYQPTNASTTESDLRKDLSRRGYCPDHPSTKVRFHISSDKFSFTKEKLYTPCKFCVEAFELKKKQLEINENVQKVKQLLDELHSERSKREAAEDALFEMEMKEQEANLKKEELQRQYNDLKAETNKSMLSMSEENLKLKHAKLQLLLVGDSGIGKSWLRFRYIHGRTPVSGTNEDNSTIGIDFSKKATRGIECTLWDTAGQERFRSLTTSNFRSKHVIFICCSFWNTFEKSGLKLWYNECIEHCPSDAIIIFVGCMSDATGQHRQLNEQEAIAFASSKGCPFIPVS